MPDSQQPAAPAVPPPSAEVTVRTLATDLEAIKASGGAILSPQGEISQVSHADPHIVQGSNGHLLSTIVSWLAVFLAVLALGAGAYIAYGYLTAPEAVPAVGTPPPAPAQPAGQNPASAGTLASEPKTLESHTSLLVRPAAHTGTFPLEAPEDTLKTHFQLIREGFERVPAAARTAELTPTDAAGKPLSLAGFLSTIGAPDLVPPSTYTDFFQPDFTLLLVRGPGGLSPAYIISLRADAAWLYAEPGVRTLETKTSTPNLFLQLQPPRLASFSDAEVTGQPARAALYSLGSGTDTFTYGYVRNRLIIATSKAALDEALLLLCLEPDRC